MKKKVSLFFFAVFILFCVGCRDSSNSENQSKPSDNYTKKVEIDNVTFYVPDDSKEKIEDHSSEGIYAKSYLYETSWGTIIIDCYDDPWFDLHDTESIEYWKERTTTAKNFKQIMIGDEKALSFECLSGEEKNDSVYLHFNGYNKGFSVLIRSKESAEIANKEYEIFFKHIIMDTTQKKNSTSLFTIEGEKHTIDNLSFNIDSSGKVIKDDVSAKSVDYNDGQITLDIKVYDYVEPDSLDEYSFKNEIYDKDDILKEHADDGMVKSFKLGCEKYNNINILKLSYGYSYDDQFFEPLYWIEEKYYPTNRHLVSFRIKRKTRDYSKETAVNSYPGVVNSIVLDTTKEYPKAKDKPKGTSTIGSEDSYEYKKALSTAKSYVKSSEYSKEELIKTLEHSKFSKGAAKYAAENCGANWNEQALKRAKKIRGRYNSAKILEDMLISYGFTYSEAKYASDRIFITKDNR